MHGFDLPSAPGRRLPLMVLVSRAPEVLVVEGAADYGQTRDYLRRIAPSLFPASRAP